MSRLEERLDKDLTRIRNELAEQAERVMEAVKEAVRAVQTGDRALAHATVLADHPANRAMRRIDQLCHSFIAVHLPSAGHLRLLSAAIRVNIELERIGDYAVTIAREAVQLSSPPDGVTAREIERFASEALLMLRQAVKGFNDLNAEAAHATKAIADPVEHNLDEVYADLMRCGSEQKVKDLFATFIVFTQIKRVVDQAKNICEDTIFAVTGEQKAAKRYNILFVDDDNGLLSLMAEAIARTNHAEAGRYISAGTTPAAAINADLAAFLDERDSDRSECEPSAISALTTAELAEQHVVVSLGGPVEGYVEKLPFHTAALRWEVAVPPAGDRAALETAYRDIAVHVSDLMELLRGEE